MPAIVRGLMPQARGNKGRTDGAWRPLAAATALMLMTALGGCNSAINAYRNMRGLSKNDPNPATAPNTKNLAIAEAEPYPNLASVPAPPTGVSTAAERQAMLRSLTAGRTDLEATDRKLRAGAQLAFVSPLPPPPLPPGAAAGNPPAGTPQPSAKPMVVRKPGVRAPHAIGDRVGTPPPLPGPLESPLVSPRIAAIPQPEAARSAPPPPHLAAVLVPARPALPSIARSPRGQAARGGAVAAAAGFRPPPPPPLIAPIAAPRLAPAAKPQPPEAAAAIKLAEIRFPAGATRLTAGDRPIVAKIAALYRQRPGPLRIVGFAGNGGGAARQLASFRTALDRAQAVAAALAKAGIPAAKIKIEAAPAGADSGAARAEIMLQP
jgi:outer membrane protein OmpA-like peptidoglycan-associated protein